MEQLISYTKKSKWTIFTNVIIIHPEDKNERWNLLLDVLMAANIWCSMLCFLFFNHTKPQISSCTKYWCQIDNTNRCKRHTPIAVTNWQTAHFTDWAPYGYISVVAQPPQVTCAIWFARKDGKKSWLIISLLLKGSVYYTF